MAEALGLEVDGIRDECRNKNTWGFEVPFTESKKKILEIHQCSSKKNKKHSSHDI